MGRIFISDLHLAEVDSPQFQTFLRLLRTEAPTADALYILGDLCEVWVGDDDDGPFARALGDALVQASGLTRIFFIHGNRDFLIGEAFARQAGITLLDGPQQLDEGTLIAHGDEFCTDDVAYQDARRTLRSRQWQEEVLGRPLEERRGLARSMREQSIASSANKPANIMDVNRNEIARVMAASNASCLVHGHTHRPGVHDEPRGKRYVLGAWERCGWLLRQLDATELQLECFALVDRCEI